MNRRGTESDKISKAINQLDQLIDSHQFDLKILNDLQSIKSDLESDLKSDAPDVLQVKQFLIHFNDAPCGVFLLDKTGIFLEVNNIALKQLGYSRKKIMSMSVSDLITSSGGNDGLDKLNELLLGEDDSAEFHLKRSDDLEFSVTVKTVHVTETLILLFTTEVDQQKIIEKALIESEIKNKALTEVTNEAIFITDKGYCLECNPSASRMFGYSYEEFLGQFATFVAAPEGAETLKTNIMKGVVFPYEVMLQRKDGSKFWGEIQGKNYQYKGKNVRVTSIRDVSDRKKYEQDLHRMINELKESEEKVRALSDATNEAIFYSDEGVCVECNQAACKMFGYEHDELIGEYAANIVAPDSRELVLQKVHSGYEEPYEAIGLRKDGSTFIAEFDGKMYRYQGKMVRLTTVRDLSAQKKAEFELKKTEEKLKLFADNTNDIIWTVDHQLNFIYVSPSIKRVLGYSPEKMIGKPLPNLLTKTSYELAQKAIHNFKDNLYIGNEPIKNRPIEFELKHKKGKTIWMEVQANAIIDTEKNIEFITGVSRDITQWKKDEAMLRQAADIFENIQSGIHIYRLEDLKDDKSLRLIAANPASEKITGFPTEFVIGKTIDENFPSLRKMGIPKKYANVVRTKKPIDFDSIEYEDDKIEHLMVTVKAFPLPNDCLGVSFENISKLKKTQNELQIRNQELNNFVYKVSHDLRAPLASIKGLIHLANYDRGPDEYLNRIDSSIQKLDDFIRNVLSHSRNLNTKPIVDIIDFRALIDQCFHELSYLPGVKKLKKEVSISGEDYFNDSIRIFEIFRNIISNAIKYQDHKKTTSYLNINISIEKEKVGIVVEDNGIGIGKEHLKKIYNMFYRASEKSDGSGIGLYIVYQALQKLKGTIKVKSEENQGTTFAIEIPNLTK